MKCPYCNTENDTDAKYCRYCGRDLRQTEPHTDEDSSGWCGCLIIILIVGIGVFIWHTWFRDNSSDDDIELPDTTEVTVSPLPVTENDVEPEVKTDAANGIPMYGTTRAYTDNAVALKYLREEISKNGNCRLGAITTTKKGVVVYEDNGSSWCGCDSVFGAKMKDLFANKKRFKSIAMTTSGYWCIVYDYNHWWGKVPQEMQNKLNQYYRDGESIDCVSISENGNYLVISDKHFYASNSTDYNNLMKAKEKYGCIKYACITNLGFIAICNQGIYYSEIPSNLEDKLKVIDFKPDRVVFTDSGTYLITNDSGEKAYWM